MKVNLLEGEHLDDLELDNLKIIQKDSGYKFSTDSVLLANFAKAKQDDICVDLCSGSGVVAMLFLWKNKIKKTYAVEIQPRLADMAMRSVSFNNLNERLQILNIDLKETPNVIGYESADVVTVNPPYNTNESHSETEEIAIATHEIKTNLQEIVSVSSKILKYGGKLFMVHRADRLVDIVDNMRKCNLEPKRLQIVYPKKTKEPNLVLIEAKKGANPGLKILSPLILNNEDGTETEELKKIYNRKA